MIPLKKDIISNGHTNNILAVALLLPHPCQVKSRRDFSADRTRKVVVKPNYLVGLMVM
jgi:hypothetical protein